MVGSLQRVKEEEGKKWILGSCCGAVMQDSRPVSSSVTAMLENLGWIRFCFSFYKAEIVVGKKHRLVDAK